MLILLIAALAFVVIFMVFLVIGADINDELEEREQLNAISDYLELKREREELRAAAKLRKQIRDHT